MNRFYVEIDKKSQDMKTPQAHRQRMIRQVSTEKSSRPKVCQSGQSKTDDSLRTNKLCLLVC